MRHLWPLMVAVIVASSGALAYGLLAQPAAPHSCSPFSGTNPPLFSPLGSPPFGFSYVNNTTSGGLHWYNFVLLPVPANLRVGQLFVMVSTTWNGTPIPVEEFLVWNGSAGVIAVANGTTSAWVQGASAPLVGLDNLTVVSKTVLVDVYVVGTVPGVCGVAAISTVWLG